jgi:hypothetical protein
MTGNYTLQFTYPGETVGTAVMIGSKSPILTLEVTNEPVSNWPAAPLPTEYWTRPINAQNREWSAISNNWYGVPILFGNTWGGSSNWLPEGSAPNSAHILWTTVKDLGGLVGGELNDVGYYSGGSYENKWTPPVILDGRLYYNQRLGSSNLGLYAKTCNRRKIYSKTARPSLGQAGNIDQTSTHLLTSDHGSPAE